MKTSSITSATHGKVNPKYALMAITGILIAVICTLVLLREIPPKHDTEKDLSVFDKAPAANRGVVGGAHLVISVFKLSR